MISAALPPDSQLPTPKSSSVVSLGFAVALFAAVVSPVSAQIRGLTPRVEAAFGGGLSSGGGLGTADANLRDRTGGPYRLFSTSSELGWSPPVEVRLSFPLTARYAFEGRALYSRPELRTAVSNDVEGAPGVTSSEHINQYVLDGALMVLLAPSRARRAVPFVSGGVGWVLQVHEGFAATEDGISYRGGGGLKYLLSRDDKGFIRGWGVRADGNFVVTTGDAAQQSGAARRLEATGAVYLVF